MRLPSARGLANLRLPYTRQYGPSLLPTRLKSGDAAASLIARKWARHGPNLTRGHRRSLHGGVKEPDPLVQAVGADTGLPEHFRDFKDYCMSYT